MGGDDDDGPAPGGGVQRARGEAQQQSPGLVKPATPPVATRPPNASPSLLTYHANFPYRDLRRLFIADPRPLRPRARRRLLRCALRVPSRPHKRPPTYFTRRLARAAYSAKGDESLTLNEYVSHCSISIPGGQCSSTTTKPRE